MEANYVVLVTTPWNEQWREFFEQESFAKEYLKNMIAAGAKRVILARIEEMYTDGSAPIIRL